jgi:RecB family exonuclease
MIALSWSRLSDYQQCPLKFKYKYISKNELFKEDGTKSVHLVRGSNVHKALENYVMARTDPYNPHMPEPSSLKEVEETKPWINNFINNYDQVIPETQIAVNRNWERVEWFSQDAYYRAILDMIAIRPSDIFIGDYKTGQLRDYDPPDGHGQLHLAGAITLGLWPDVPKIKVAYAYVDHKQVIQKDFTQDDKKPLQAHFDRQSEIVNSDKEFRPTPNEFCKWCPATKTMCPYSRKI